ncbi:MAG TPA: retropepsin-like aspartic protease [Thermoplasmata archaeon]|nr:retropepsin-like aspartic protease [Thermoplasmata archaeon]
MRRRAGSLRFEYLGSHLILVPVELSGRHRSRFILDTGVGVNVIAPALAERSGARATGAVQTGRRMSGQELSLPVVEIPSLRLGSETHPEVPAGLFDLDRFLPPGVGVGGMVGLPLFEQRPFVIDPAARELRLGARLPANAPRAPLTLRRDHLSLDAFLDLELPGGTSARVELDTGSDALILHTRYMDALGIRPDDPRVRRTEGRDEVGHPYVRYRARLDGTVRLRAAPEIARPDLDVIFSDVIYDGLVGHAFLSAFTVGIDVAAAEIAFGPARWGATDPAARTSGS